MELSEERQRHSYEYKEASDFLWKSVDADYCRFFAFKHFPDLEEDEEGNTVIYGSAAGFDIIRFIMFGDPQFLFTKKEYLGNSDIQDSIKAMGLDSEKLWWAIAFVHHLANTKYRYGYTVKDTMRDQLKKFVDVLSDPGAELIAKGDGKRKVCITEKDVLSIINNSLVAFLDGNAENAELDMRAIEYGEDREVEESCSMQICYETGCYMDILKYASEHAEIPKRKKGVSASRDKLLLISRIIHMEKLTYNDAYLHSTDNLKGVLKSYRNKNIYRASGWYLV